MQLGPFCVFIFAFILWPIFIAIVVFSICHIFEIDSLFFTLTVQEFAHEKGYFFLKSQPFPCHLPTGTFRLTMQNLYGLRWI